MSKKKKTSSSVGSELVRRLKGFTSALQGTDDLHEKFTCRTLGLNLKPTTCSPAAVKEARRVLCASQTIFARFLGVSPSAVRDWEQGLKPPNGAACRLMDEIRLNPTYFAKRLQDLAKVNANKSN